MIFKYAKFFVVLIFIGCSSKNETPQYIDGDDLIPPAPSFMSYFSIHGEDSDNDGVRDDFEIYINKKIEDNNYRLALKHDAKIYNDYMKANNANEINRLFNEQIDSSICISVLRLANVKKNVDEAGELRSRLYNNYWRKKHYDNQGQLVKGGIYSYGNGSIMASLKRCKFKFKNLHKSLEGYLKNERYKYGMNQEEIKEFESLMGIHNDKK